MFKRKKYLIGIIVGFLILLGGIYFLTHRQPREESFTTKVSVKAGIVEVQANGDRNIQLGEGEETIIGRGLPSDRLSKKSYKKEIDELRDIINKLKAEINDYLAEIESLKAQLDKEKQAEKDSLKEFEGILSRTGIRGHVYDLGKNPVEDATISLASEADLTRQQLVTNRDGYYEATHLREGSYSLVLSLYPDDEVTLKVQYGKMTTQDFGKKGVRLYGYLYDQNHNPLTANIQIMGPMYNVMHKNSDEEGYYEFENIPPAEYMVSISRGSPTDRGMAASISIPVKVSEYQHDIYLSSASLSGRVVDEDTDETIADVKISAFCRRGKNSSVARASSDQYGYYQLGNLLPGKYRINFWPDGYAHKSINVTIEESENITDYDIQLTPVNPLWLSLKDQYGQPVTIGVKFVASYDGSSISKGLIPPDEDGFLKISDLRPGEYKIMIQAQGYEPAKLQVNLPEEGYPKDSPLKIKMNKLD